MHEEEDLYRMFSEALINILNGSFYRFISLTQDSYPLVGN